MGLGTPVAMDTAAFDAIMAAVDSPLVVVTAAAGEQRGGCVAGFHTQCGLDPPRYAVWLSKANLTYRVALFASHLAVHLLDARDHDLAELFGGTTGDDVDKFARCDWTLGPAGVPLLDRCASVLVLQRTATCDTGDDHVCFIGAPVDARHQPGLRPFHLSDAADIEPGHAAEERPQDLDLRTELAAPPPQ
jgi:flavin reductase (DIM6/NTAB) family NADH-FMN oxidoreductase RutF